MSRTRRQFSLEYKQQTVELMEREGRSLSSLSRDLGIDRKVLRRWKQQFSQEGSTEREQSDLQRENQRLRRENQKLLRERELLKKVLSIVSDG